MPHPRTPECQDRQPSRSSNNVPGSGPPRPTRSVPGGSHRSPDGKPVPPHAPATMAAIVWAIRSVHSGNSEDPDPFAPCLRYRHGLHGRRKVTPRRETIPQLEQVVLQDPARTARSSPRQPGRALVGLDPQIRLPDHPFRNLKRFDLRLRFAHLAPPETRLTTKRTRTTRPLRSSPITGPSSLLQGGPPPCPASVLSPSQFQLLGVLPYAGRANTRPDTSRRGVPTFHTGA